MFCSNCGGKLTEGMAFCTQCGQPVAAPPVAAPSLGASVYAPPAFIPVPRRRRVWPFVLAGCILLLGGAALALVLTGVLAPAPASSQASAEASLGSTLPADELLAEAQRFLSEGDYRKAARDFEDYLALMPSDAAGYIGLAQAQSALGDAEAAQKTLASGLEKAMETSLLRQYALRLSGGQLSDDAKAYADMVYALNTTAQAEGVDVFAEKHTPNPRDLTLIWDKSIYLRVGNSFNFKNVGNLAYTVSRKQLMNAATGNPMEYEIYTHPGTGRVEKIVSIEYIADYLQITDYYYAEDGRPNFVFVRYDTVYTPESAMLDMQGERYFFDNDTMVRWRVIDTSGRKDYPVGVNEDIRGAADKKFVTLYSSLSPDMQQRYDDNERKYLNAAYNTLDAVTKSPGVSSIVGTAADQNGNPVAGAAVQLFAEDLKAWVYEGVTDADGAYEIRVPSENRTFHVRVAQAGCTPVDVYGVELSPQLINAYLEPACLVSESSSQLDVRLLVIDAFNAFSGGYGDDYATGLLRLDAAQVLIRPGINNRTGAVLFEGYSDSKGWLSLTLPPGCYTAEVLKDGYATAYLTVVARASGEVVQLSATPVLSGGEVRIVLTWGSTPADLDSHLFTPYDAASQDTTYHIWYGNMTDWNGNDLDVDDTTGYGPETMTIRHLGTGLYKYYVADFTNCDLGNPASYDMSYSGATVSVYTDRGLAASFHVPVDASGVIWEVFEISNMQVVPIQRYYSNIKDKPWWNQDK